MVRVIRRCAQGRSLPRPVHRPSALPGPLRYGCAAALCPRAGILIRGRHLHHYNLGITLLTLVDAVRLGGLDIIGATRLPSLLTMPRGGCSAPPAGLLHCESTRRAVQKALLH